MTRLKFDDRLIQEPGFPSARALVAAIVILLMIAGTAFGNDCTDVCAAREKGGRKACAERRAQDESTCQYALSPSQCRKDVSRIYDECISGYKNARRLCDKACAGNGAETRSGICEIGCGNINRSDPVCDARWWRMDVRWRRANADYWRCMEPVAGAEGPGRGKPPQPPCQPSPKPRPGPKPKDKTS